MIDRRFELRQNPPERRNEHLPDNQVYTSQTTVLTSEDGTQIAEINTYLDSAYYGFHWQTTKSEAELVQLAEECVRYYEESYPDGVLDLKGEQTDPFGRNLPSSKYASGVIVFVRENEQGDRMELDYQRPLSWGQIEEVANGREITLGRFNTPIGDFIVQQYGGNRSFGVISHLKEASGFANLLVKSATGEVPQEQAQELLKQAISAFPEKPPQE